MMLRWGKLVSYRRMAKSKAEAESTTGRIEAFSDGVFAIAIALLILEIKVPELPGADTAGATFRLGLALLHLWPSYFVYLFSFLMIGIYWANHHYIFRLYERSNHWLVLLNLPFLMCISFLPFPTAVLAAYIENPHYQQAALLSTSLGCCYPPWGGCSCGCKQAATIGC